MVTNNDLEGKEIDLVNQNIDKLIAENINQEEFISQIAFLSTAILACGDDFEYTDEPSPVCENDAVRFSSANPTSIEADPSEPYFQIVVKRDAKAAASYSVSVVENQDGAFTVRSRSAGSDQCQRSCSYRSDPDRGFG